VKDRLPDIALWAWLIGATAAYLFQFQGFARPILHLLGVA